MSHGYETGMLAALAAGAMPVVMGAIPGAASRQIFSVNRRHDHFRGLSRILL